MFLGSYVRAVDALNEWVGKTVMWLFLALTASVIIDMFARFLTGQSTDWAFDINYMIYGINFMLAGAFCMKHDTHVRVDALYAKFPPRVRAVLEIIFFLAIMFPFTYFCLDSTWDNFLQAWESKEVSIVSAWHPPIYHYKAVMPLAFALLLLQEVAQFIRYVNTAVKGEQS
ncbi:MAG: TRAP transporter small permease subunit [Thermodesulfobacteriota bacterium]